ncbi:CsbD family protein [Streptomyces sp. NBC_00448]|uniref:CsbD family protein n=1 Tax=Streptomyces sp. NBC_00448 TaxID=2903652 RepID=UPI002E249E76
MSDSDKAKAKSDQVKGKVKESVGQAVGDEELEAQGRGDQAKGDVRQAGEKLKDAVKHIGKD